MDQDLPGENDLLVKRLDMREEKLREGGQREELVIVGEGIK